MSEHSYPETRTPRMAPRRWEVGGRTKRALITLVAFATILLPSNGLVLLGISPFWQTAFIGAVIIAAVAIDKWLPGRSRA